MCPSARRIVRNELYGRIMSTLHDDLLRLVDPVHAGAEAPWERPLAGPPGWRPVAGDSAVWDG